MVRKSAVPWTPRPLQPQQASLTTASAQQRTSTAMPAPPPALIARPVTDRRLQLSDCPPLGSSYMHGRRTRMLATTPMRPPPPPDSALSKGLAKWQTFAATSRPYVHPAVQDEAVGDGQAHRFGPNYCPQPWRFCTPFPDPEIHYRRQDYRGRWSDLLPLGSSAGQPDRYRDHRFRPKPYDVSPPRFATLLRRTPLSGAMLMHPERARKILDIPQRLHSAGRETTSTVATARGRSQWGRRPCRPAASAAAAGTASTTAPTTATPVAEIPTPFKSVFSQTTLVADGVNLSTTSSADARLTKQTDAQASLSRSACGNGSDKGNARSIPQVARSRTTTSDKTSSSKIIPETTIAAGRQRAISDNFASHKVATRTTTVPRLRSGGKFPSRASSTSSVWNRLGPRPEKGRSKVEASSSDIQPNKISSIFSAPSSENQVRQQPVGRCASTGPASSAVSHSILLSQLRDRVIQSQHDLEGLLKSRDVPQKKNLRSQAKKLRSVQVTRDSQQDSEGICATHVPF
ncbi:uncharacterized protein EV422DRAFT_298771 [Fimicolochytrium jonesii]|uniref:uncharacterized protein n=1 Tax=Fimicolochytrium jonesii TaxID=1396493 RepID=UPI0022FE3D7B|nr:uncharacterized protein EV422DRAFT_298771 [Fimicolochytrium jonesii]KAI8816215.1 hypothetical protein EV422DRAFT_298771 [Fimicolochytrium jonesii]